MIGNYLKYLGRGTLLIVAMYALAGIMIFDSISCLDLLGRCGDSTPNYIGVIVFLAIWLPFVGYMATVVWRANQ